MAKNEMSFEQQLQRLEEIVSYLDQNDLPIDQMIKLYEEGMVLAQKCRKFLDKTEQKVVEINKTVSPELRQEELDQYTKEIPAEDGGDATFEDYLPE